MGVRPTIAEFPEDMGKTKVEIPKGKGNYFWCYGDKLHKTLKN